MTAPVPAADGGLTAQVPATDGALIARVPAASPGLTAQAQAPAPGALARHGDRAVRERRYAAEGWWTAETLPGYVLGRCENPAAVAVSWAGGSLTGEDLARQVSGAAGSLRRLGIRPGDRVLVQLPNEPGLIVIVLALARIGAAAVLAVPGLRERELRHVTDTAGAALIVVSETAQRGANLAAARKLAASCRSVRGLIVSGASAGPGEMLLGQLIADGRDLDAPWPAPSDVALYLLSGGTTGLPKLIPRTHRDYVCNLKVSAAVAGLGPDSTYLAALPASHNFALGCPGVLGTLAAGGRVVLTEARLVGGAVEAMAAEGATIAAAVPGLAVRWAQHARAEPGLARRLRLRVIQVGGARLHAAQARELSAALGATVQQVYGMAEGMLCFTRLDDPAEVTEQTQGRPACPADEWRVVDETETDVPPGQPGELLVRGPYTIGGYLASESDNAAAFAPGGWYRTGDIVRQHPSGNFVVEGRRKDFINCGGEKVSAEEIEELVVTYPGVAAAAVVAAPAELLGEEVCVFVTAGAAPPSLRELRGHLTRLGVAPFKLPARLRVLGELPVTAVGKVDKAALRALARNDNGRE